MRKVLRKQGEKKDYLRLQCPHSSSCAKWQKNKPEQVTPAIQRNKIEQKKGDNKTSDNNSNTWITLTVLIIHDSGVIVK